MRSRHVYRPDLEGCSATVAQVNPPERRKPPKVSRERPEILAANDYKQVGGVWYLPEYAPQGMRIVS